MLGAALFAPGRGGIARVARAMGRAVAEAGHELELLSLLDEPGAHLDATPITSARRNQLLFGLLCRWKARHVTHAIYDSAGIARAHPSGVLSRRPYAVFIHGIEVWEGLRRDRANAIAGADLVLVNSHYTLQRFQDLHGPLANAVVCPLATEEDDPPADEPAFAGPPRALIVARIEGGETYKGHDHLVASWPAVVAAVPDARLVIVGDGSGFDDLRRLVESSPAAANIDLKGYVAEGEIDAIWREAHVFAMPSRCEGFGLVYVEAMRFGLPVIASVHDAGAEVNAHGESGFNVDLDQPGDLTRRLIELLGDRNKAREMGKAAQRRWTDHFRGSAFRQRFTAIVSDFFRGGRGQG